MDKKDPTKPRRLWRVIFALSLAMNVAVVGVVVGFGAREKGRGMSARGFDMSLGPIGRALSVEDRRAIAAELRNDPALFQGRRGQSRAMIDALTSVLRSTPFDQAALATLMADAGTQTARVQTAARAALVARISQMNDGERLALAARLENAQRKRQ